MVVMGCLQALATSPLGNEILVPFSLSCPFLSHCSHINSTVDSGGLYFASVMCKGEDWLQLPQGGGSLWTAVNIVMTIWSKVCDIGIVMQLFCLLHISAYFYLKHIVLETGFCLRPKTKSSPSGPYFQRPTQNRIYINQAQHKPPMRIKTNIKNVEKLHLHEA